KLFGHSKAAPAKSAASSNVSSKPSSSSASNLSKSSSSSSSSSSSDYGLRMNTGGGLSYGDRTTGHITTDLLHPGSMGMNLGGGMQMNLTGPKAGQISFGFNL